ncbi:MAG: DUF488 family protein [Microthrixaceae bacterium]|nr:DUF488 family protein [Microthrixaceae bacterium]
MTQLSTRVWLRRAYEEPTRNDGHRVLVDRLWPRGVSKERLRIDQWCRDVAPSDDLRKWFGHDPARWDEFLDRYRKELTDHDEEVSTLVEAARSGRVTLVYAAGDTEHNNAVALGRLIEERR